MVASQGQALFDAYDDGVAAELTQEGNIAFVGFADQVLEDGSHWKESLE